MISLLPRHHDEANELVNALLPLVRAQMQTRVELYEEEPAPEDDERERDYIRAVLAAEPWVYKSAHLSAWDTRDRRLSILATTYAIWNGPGRGDVSQRLIGEIFAHPAV